MDRSQRGEVTSSAVVLAFGLSSLLLGLAVALHELVGLSYLVLLLIGLGLLGVAVVAAVIEDRRQK